MLRSRRARPTVPLDPTPLGPDDAGNAISAVDLPSSDPSPEDQAERTELREAIEVGLATLQAEQRLAVLLVDIQGMTYEESAVAMDCSLGTVKSRVSRGRSGLRAYLRQTGELLPSRFRQDD